MIVFLALSSFILITYTTGRLDASAKRSGETSETALLTVEASDKLSELLLLIQGRIDAFMRSPEVAELSPERKYALEVELARTDFGAANPKLDDLRAPFSMAETVQLQTTLSYLTLRITAIVARTGNAELQASANTESARVGAVIEQFYLQPTISNLHNLQLLLEGVKVGATTEIPRLIGEAESQRDELGAATRFLRTGVLISSVVATILLASLGHYISRRISRILAETQAERAALSETTESLMHRNDQLNALYNVFAEITDTLSLRYVVQATIRESLRIMDAELAVLRILRGNELVVAGAVTATGQEIEGLKPVALGEGPTGRTAKRGRTLRIDSGGERMMTPEEPDSEGGPSAQTQRPGLLESGLIVPLIVGARVVGTLSCWAREPSRYGPEDERIMEMMASQAATAIVAADTTDTSVKRAQHDALTGLPNRRQLDEDIQGVLSEMAESGRQASVAMVDIDHFKRFNDDFGHKMGDVTLQKVASVLRTSVRDVDYVYRYGGEEFVVVFADAGSSEARTLADRLRTAVQATPLTGENLEPVGPITISIGLALMPDHGTEIEALIAMADKAMYRAKDAGRNRVEVWDERDATSLSVVA
jgi:diguanylate cyclase (GGDEF)-like protein